MSALANTADAYSRKLDRTGNRISLEGTSTEQPHGVAQENAERVNYLDLSSPHY